MIPDLTRFIFHSVRTSAAWTIEAFVSLCEALVRAVVQSTILVFVAVLLIYGSTWFQSRELMIAGLIVGFIGFGYLAIASSVFRIGIEALAEISILIKREVERLSNIMFGGVLAIFYLSLDRAYEHPFFLLGFLSILVVLYWATILPDSSWTLFFKKRFQWLILLSAISLTIVAVTPEAIAIRITGGHWPQKITGTVAEEIPYHLDDQDQIVNDFTNRPMIFFDQVADKDSDQPRPLIGWTFDNKKNQHHLYRWFEGQKNYTGLGQAIEPVTREKIDEIIDQTKRVAEEKLVVDKKIADEQKAIVDAEVARLKAEVEAEREEQLRLARLPISIAGTLLAPDNDEQDVISVRPSESFTYKGTMIDIDRGVMEFDIVDVQPAPAPEKDKYVLTLQLRRLIPRDGNSRNISQKEADPIQLLVKKDSRNPLKRIFGGDGVVRGRTLVTASTGGVVAVASHGKKFRLVVGDPVPSIVITPVL